MERIEPTLILVALVWASAITALSVAYYHAEVVTPLWTEAFRKYRGRDHVGYVLEAVFVSLTAAALGTVAALQPELAARMLFVMPNAAFTWWFVLAGALTMWIVLMRMNVGAFRTIAAQRIRRKSVRAQAHDATSERAVRKQYAVYSIYAFGSVLCLFLATAIVLWGSLDGITRVGEVRSQLVSAFTSAHRAFLTGNGLDDAMRAAFLKYAEFYDIVVHTGTRTVLAVGVLLLPATWMLWRPAQTLYMPATITIIKHYACILLLVILPGILCYTYATVAWTWETVERETDELSHAFALQGTVNEEVRELLNLKLNMMGDVSPRGLVERLAFNGGIFVVAAQVGFAVLQQRRVGESFWRNLLPEWVKRILRLMDIAKVKWS